MSLQTPAAPHWLGNNTVAAMMRTVLLALLPMLVVASWYLGPGIIANTAVACGACCAFEAGMLKWRGQPLAPFLLDSSALVTGVLLGLCLPPLLPWWVTLVACLFAIVVAKHAYGGLGHNVFNPAMAGYLVALVAFPQYVADWPALTPDSSWPAFSTWLNYFALGSAPPNFDALSGATPLDSVKTGLGQMQMMSELTAEPGFGLLAGRGWEWINLAGLAGGVWIVRREITSWHAPAGMLVTLALLYFGFYALDADANPSPVLGLLSGGTMLAAFFIVTDPVSGAAAPRGRLIFGAGVGLLTFCMRKWGAYPDGIAFAVLFMNMTAPLIDRYTVPRIYGHRGGGQ